MAIGLGSKHYDDAVASEAENHGSIVEQSGDRKRVLASVIAIMTVCAGFGGLMWLANQ